MQLTSAAALALILSFPALAEAAEAEDFLSMDLADLVQVKLATGTLKPLSKAPAVATVITAADIEAMGAVDLDEALAMVPGLHVSHSGEAYAPRYMFRGLASKFNAEALVLLNGVPVTSAPRGDRHAVSMRIPAAAIARVEVIRGPGSAVYGADAYAGVINVITKDREDLDGTTLGVRTGSFDSHSVWLNHGGDWGALRTALTLSYYETDGHRETISADAQTGFDNLAQLLGIPAPAVSLAPGPVDLGGRYTDLHAALGYDNWKLHLGYWDRTDIGLGQGVAAALDHHGRIGYQGHLADLSYDDAEFAEHWALEAKVSYYRVAQRIERELHLFPPGAFFGAYPEGFIGNPVFEETQTRFELAGIYTGFSGHRLRLGAGYFYADNYRIAESKNFDATFAPLPGGVTDVTDTPAVFLPEGDRKNPYALVQDEWQLADDWELTAGLRYDDYSDFGSTTNPRLALVWSATDTLTAKLLYGRAFRAPSFIEQKIINNPVALGNPDLEPQTIVTTELALGWQASPVLRLDLNLYDFKAEDFIRHVKDPGQPTFTAQNAATLRGQGLEFELRYALSDTLRLLGNYSYQDTEDEGTGEQAGEAPRSKLYLRADWQFASGWNADAQLIRVGRRDRAAADPRDALEGYTTLDLSLRRNALWENLDLALVLRNAFDEDVREPSSTPAEGSAFIDIPNDLPQAGRSVFLELAYRL